MDDLSVAMAPSYSPLATAIPIHDDEAVKKTRTAGRLLSLKRPTGNVVVPSSSKQQLPSSSSLVECAFVAGLCHDASEGEYSTFSREKYPTQVHRVVSFFHLPIISHVGYQYRVTYLYKGRFFLSCSNWFL